MLNIIRKACTGRGPIIVKLHATCKCLRNFGPIFEKDICDKLSAGQQNYMFVSMHIPKKFKKKLIRTHKYIYKEHGGSHGRKI